MDNCGICMKPAVQLFETSSDGVYACFKCQPLVPEVTIDDSNNEQTEEVIEHPPSDQKNMQLQNHMRNHRAERRFVCTYCNKAFSQSNNLRAHLRIHTNERPFKCTECGKAFTQVTNLNNHVRLHTGERPFVCPELGCDKAYAQVTNLNQHRKRHLSGRPLENSYSCTVCGEQFQQRNHMYTHRREAHGEVKSPVRQRERAVQKVQVQVPDESQTDGDEKLSYTCVFSACGEVLSSPREHTEHLLRAHQLRVLAAAPSAAKRGRPPKVNNKILKDPLEIKEEDYHEVKILKQPQYMPKLKVQNLFQ